MLNLLKYFLILYLLIVSSIINAQNKLQFCELGDFKLESGEIINNCEIGYRTYGKLNGKKNNAILFTTWFGGITEHLRNYIGPDKPLDSTKYFIITVDALGNGVSSSPSNSIQQPNERFPLFNIRDMVNSQHELLEKVFDINHLYGLYGGSMGGMQVFEWIVSYPEFINKAVAYVGSPKLTSYDLLLWQTELNAIETGHKYNVPDEEILKTVSAIQSLLMRTPEYLNEHNVPEKFHDQLNKIYNDYKNLFKSYDWAVQLRAMMQHDVSRPFGSMEEAAKRVKAEVFIIVGS